MGLHTILKKPRGILVRLRQAFDAKFEESKHPRGQPENKGEFASSPGGGGSLVESPFFAKGSYLPDVIYRGASEGNLEQSTMSEGEGVYVSTDPNESGQWGKVHKFHMKKRPNVLDLGNFEGRARDFVAKIVGVPSKRLTKEAFEEEVPTIFIQNQGVNILKQMGFAGYRVGRDAFLLGKLSDYVDQPDHPRGHKAAGGEFK